MNIENQIIGEIQKATETLGADMELSAAIGSWKDTLDDGDVLALLQDWNKKHPKL